MAKYRAETLPKSVKTTTLGSFKGQIDGDTVQTFINKLDMYFSLCVLDNSFSRAAFAVTLLSCSAYT